MTCIIWLRILPFCSQGEAQRKPHRDRVTEWTRLSRNLRKAEPFRLLELFDNNGEVAPSVDLSATDVGPLSPSVVPDPSLDTAVDGIHYQGELHAPLSVPTEYPSYNNHRPATINQNPLEGSVLAGFPYFPSHDLSFISQGQPIPGESSTSLTGVVPRSSPEARFYDQCTRNLPSS